MRDYWNVILARENLEVQRKSLDEAQKSYEHDKKALSLGALPPLDIYRSESQVASQRVGVIQAEYALKQNADVFRQDIGADLDPAMRVLDLELTDQPAPTGELPSMDIATALARALANRPEFEAAKEQLASDELAIRLQHNNLKPDLELSGFYWGNGLNSSASGVDTGLTGSLSQSFHFTYPTYGASLSLLLPVRRHSAQASLADALVGRSRDQYQERRTNQSITLDVTTAVHALEEAKLSMEAAKVAESLAVDTLRADERKYELGAEPVFFVLDAQTRLAQAWLWRNSITPPGICWTTTMCRSSNPITDGGVAGDGWRGIRVFQLHFPPHPLSGTGPPPPCVFLATGTQVRLLLQNHVIHNVYTLFCVRARLSASPCDCVSV